MFYSHHLLSKKGPLGTIWIAAHYIKKLKKKQLTETDIVAAVDMILKGEAKAMAQRILSYLLLGLVKINSKKAEFLFRECRGMQDELRRAMAVQIVNKSITPMQRSYHSISIPERFELDAFNLEISEDQDASRTVDRSNEDITLADTLRWGVYCEIDKYYDREDIFFSEASSPAGTPASDVCSPWFMGIDLNTTLPDDASTSKSSMKRFVGTSFSSEKCPEPKMSGYVEKEPDFDMPSNEGSQTDRNKMKHLDFGINYHEPARVEKSIDNEPVEPMMLDNADDEAGFHVLSDEDETDGGQIRSPVHEISSQEPTRMGTPNDNESIEPMVLDNGQRVPDFFMPSSEKHPTDGEQEMLPDVEISCLEPVAVGKSFDIEQSIERLREFRIGVEEHLQPGILHQLEKESASAMQSTEEHQMVGERTKHSNKRSHLEEPKEMSLPVNEIHERNSLSISVDITPDFRIISRSGVRPPEFMAHCNPATMECATVLKKQKCLLDDKVVVSNKVVKDWICNSRDLVCKRRKVPKTVLHAWKVQKLCTFPRAFWEPLIPCKGVNFRSLALQKSTARVQVETVETSVDPIPVESPVRQMSVSAALNPVSPVHVESSVAQMSHEQTSIAPITVSPVPVESPVAQMSHEQTSIAPATLSPVHVETVETPVNPIPVESPVRQMSVKAAPNPVSPVHVESLVAQMSYEHTSIAPTTVSPVHVETVGTPVNPIPVESKVRQMSEKAALNPTSPMDVESPIAQMSHEQTSIAPTTPVSHSTSLRLQEVRETSRPDMLEHASSSDSVGKQQTHYVPESDIQLTDEEVNSSVGNNPEKCEMSARTRSVARHLHSTMKEGNGVVNLSRVLEQKTRKHCAMIFSELLALKTGGYVNVKQEEAYGDILVQETSKLEEATIDADDERSHA